MFKLRLSMQLKQAFLGMTFLFIQNCAVDFQDLSEASSSETSSTETSSGGSSAPVAFSTTWDFSTSGDYTVSSATKVAISGDASLQQLDQTHSTSGDFSSGTHVGTQYTASTLTTGSAGGCDATATNCAEFDSSWTPEYASLISYWKFEESSWNGTANEIQDLVGTNHGVRVGNATTTASSKIGAYAATLDGVGDDLNFGSDATLDFTGDFSLSFWINMDQISNQTIHYPISKGDFGASGWVVGVVGTWAGGCSAVDGSVFFGDGNSNVIACSSVPLIEDQWHHISLTVISGTVKIYIDGVERSSQAGVTVNFDAALDLVVGKRVDDVWYVDGEFDDFAIWGTGLTSSEVEAIYSRQSAKYAGYYTSAVLDSGNAAATWTAKSWVSELPFYKELTGIAGSESSTNYSSLVGSTGSTSDNDLMDDIIGLWHLNENLVNGVNGGADDFEDFSGNSGHGDESGGVTFGDNGALDGAPNFDGTDDYISISDRAAYGTDTITVAAWVKGGGNQNTGRIGGQYDYGNNNRSWNISTGDTGGSNAHRLVVVLSDDGTYTTGSSIKYYRSSLTAFDGSWHHIAFTFDGGLTNTFKLFVDGVEDPSPVVVYDNAITSLFDSAANLTIGALLTSGTAAQFFDGNIDEFAMWDRALNSSEITQLYRRGANRIKMQVRSCDDAACSGEAWVGPDGSADTYLSELNNCDLLTAATGACDFAGGADVNLTSPSLDFTDFTNLTSAVTTNQYYQYRVILESDDETSSTMPSLSSLTIGPAHYYGDNPTVELATAQSFSALTSFAVTETGTCDHRYQLSNDDGTTYYYYDGASWTAVANVTTHVNTQADVNTNISTLALGTGELKWKAIFQSDTTEDCTIDDVIIEGSL